MAGSVRAQGLVPNRLIVCFLTVLLWLSAAAHAALYEFTLEGTVTLSWIPGLAVGEPCIIRYIADDKDFEPDPGGGGYLATPPVVAFPVSNTQIPFDPTLQVNLTVALFGTGVDVVHYQHLGILGSSWDLNVSFVFPDGTLESDALPLSLPLHQAISMNFRMSPALSDHVRGQITSYSSVAIPEPSAICAILFLKSVVNSRRTRRNFGGGGVLYIR